MDHGLRTSVSRPRGTGRTAEIELDATLEKHPRPERGSDEVVPVRPQDGSHAEGERESVEVDPDFAAQVRDRR